MGWPGGETCKTLSQKTLGRTHTHTHTNGDDDGDDDDDDDDEEGFKCPFQKSSVHFKSPKKTMIERFLGRRN